MAEKPPHYLRQWRLRAKLTQEQLADAIGTTKSVISELERFNVQLSPKWLRKIAPVLKTQDGYILDYDPDDLDEDILAAWADIPVENRPQALRVLRSFKSADDVAVGE